MRDGNNRGDARVVIERVRRAKFAGQPAPRRQGLARSRRHSHSHHPTPVTEQSPEGGDRRALRSCARALAENSLCPIASAESEPGLKNEA